MGWTHSWRSSWFLLTGEVTEAGAGSISMASTDMKLTWDWVLSDLSPTTRRGWAQILTIKVNVYGCLEGSANRRKKEKYAKFSGGLKPPKTLKK